MSFDVFADYRQFREIVQDYAEHMLQFFPQTAREDWVVECYCSADDFETRFPTEEKRTQIIEDLQQTQESIDDAIRFCQPLFDMFPVENRPSHPI